MAESVTLLEEKNSKSVENLPSLQLKTELYDTKDMETGNEQGKANKTAYTEKSDKTTKASDKTTKEAVAKVSCNHPQNKTSSKGTVKNKNTFLRKSKSCLEMTKIKEEAMPHSESFSGRPLHCCSSQVSIPEPDGENTNPTTQCNIPFPKTERLKNISDKNDTLTTSEDTSDVHDSPLFSNLQLFGNQQKVHHNAETYRKLQFHHHQKQQQQQQQQQNRSQQQQQSPLHQQQQLINQQQSLQEGQQLYHKQPYAHNMPQKQPKHLSNDQKKMQQQKQSQFYLPDINTVTTSTGVIRMSTIITTVTKTSTTDNIAKSTTTDTISISTTDTIASSTSDNIATSKTTDTTVTSITDNTASSTSDNIATSTTTDTISILTTDTIATSTSDNIATSKTTDTTVTSTTDNTTTSTTTVTAETSTTTETSQQQQPLPPLNIKIESSEKQQESSQNLVKGFLSPFSPSKQNVCCYSEWLPQRWQGTKVDQFHDDQQSVNQSEDEETKTSISVETDLVEDRLSNVTQSEVKTAICSRDSINVSGASSNNLSQLATLPVQPKPPSVATADFKAYVPQKKQPTFNLNDFGSGEISVVENQSVSSASPDSSASPEVDYTSMQSSSFAQSSSLQSSTTRSSQSSMTSMDSSILSTKSSSSLLQSTTSPIAMISPTISTAGPSLMKEKKRDFILLHADADQEEAQQCRDHLKQDIGIPDLTVDLFSEIDSGHTAMMSLETLHDIDTTIF